MCALRQTFALFGIALALAAPAAHAQQRLRVGPPPQAQGRPPQLGGNGQPQTSFSPQVRRNDSPLSDSVRWAQRQNGGRVIGVERVQSEGREITRTKLIDDAGRVRYVDDDRQPAPRREERPRHGNDDASRYDATSP